jgi:hypothetical protein
MTMGGTVMEFTPSLVGCVIAGGNHSFEMIRRSGSASSTCRRQRSPIRSMRIGNVSGARIDKFREFRLSADAAEVVPLDPRVSRQFRMPPA